MSAFRHYCIAGVVALVAVTATSSAQAQSGDSLGTQILEVIVFHGVQPDSDTLQNFFRANASATTEHILSRMQGVHLVRRGAYGQEPVFRSLNGGQLNVTIDGMKIFGACTDKMDPVTIYVEPQNLSAVQAILGTQGAAFGSTFGGTLNMKLAQPLVTPQRVTGQAGMDFQTASDAFNYFSHANISGEKHAYRISGTYRKSGNYRAGGGEVIPFSQYQKVNIAAGGKWALGTSDTLQADVLYDEGRNIGFPALPMDVGNARAGIFAVTWHRVSPWFVFHNFTVKGYHNRIAHAMDDSQRNDVVMHMDMPGTSTTTGVFAEADVHIFHAHQTLVKAEYFSNDMLGEMTMYPEEGSAMYMQTAPATTRRNAGLFISQQFRFDSKNKVLFSFRGDVTTDHLHAGIGRQQWEVFHTNLPSVTTRFTKTLSVRYTRKLNNRLRLDIQNGYGERNVTLNERYGYYLFNRFDGYDYIGDPELKNENSWNSEATLQYFGEQIEWQITPFYQGVGNFIMGEVSGGYSPMTPGAKGVKQYQNLATARLAGLDLMVLARPIASVQVIATAKYTRGQTSTGEALPLIPPLKTVASIRYEKTRFHVQAEWERASAQHRVNESSGELQTPSYSLLSFRTGYRIYSFLHCNAGIENAFDRKYREHLDWGGIPRPGRNVYVNILYNFNTR